MTAPPAELRDYVLEHLLAEGTVASAYVACERRTGRRVALRLGAAAQDPEVLRPALVRAAQVQRLSHDHVLPIRSYGAEQGHWYVVSDLAHAGSVEDLLRRAGRLPVGLACRLAKEALSALAYAHAHGVCHGRVGAAALLLDAEGSLHLGDFAIAYDSARPPPSPDADLEAVGATFHTMLVGAAPSTSGQGLFELEPSVPAAVEEVVERLLGRDPAGPYSGAEEALRDLGPTARLLDPGGTDAVRDFLADPDRTRVRLDATLAQAYAVQAERAAPEAAALFLYRALRLAPEHPGAAERLERLCADHLLHFGPSRSPEGQALERSLAADPSLAEAWLKLGRIYAVEGNPLYTAVCLKRYLRARPEDAAVAEEVARLTGGRARPAAASAPADGVPQGPPQAPPQEPPARASDGMWRPTGAVGAVPAPVRPLAAGPAAPPPKEFWNGPGRILAVLFAGVWLAVILQRWLGGAPPTTLAGADPSPGPGAGVGPAAAMSRLSEAMGRLQSGDESAERDLKAILRGRVPSTARSPRAVERERTAPGAGAPGAPLALEPLPEPTRRSGESAPALLKRARELQKRGQHEAALGDLTTLIEEHPQSPLLLEAFLARADAHAAAGNLLEAAKDFRRVLTRTTPQDELHRRANEGMSRLFASQRVKR